MFKAIFSSITLSLGLLLSGPLFAQVEHRYPDRELLESGIPVIDIRTESEWLETGVVDQAIPITFFDARGQHDARRFLSSLARHVDKNEPIALICRTGNRTSTISQFLSDQGYHVINLQGGMFYLLRQGYQPIAYEQRVAELVATGDCQPNSFGC